MPSQYTPFRTDFPAFAVLDALAAIKDGAANTPAGRLQLAHSAYELEGWAFHCTLDPTAKSFVNAPMTNASPLTDEQALDLLNSLQAPENAENGRLMAGCPIPPQTAWKLARWLLKAAEIVLPALL